MAVELVWKSAGALIEEPEPLTAGLVSTVTLTNNGDNYATEVGFYLEKATLEGDVDNPSTVGILSDWYDILTWGAVVATGLSITQGATTTQFTHNLGCNSVAPIPLSIGSGLSGDTLGPGESVTLSLLLVPPGGTPARRLYTQIGITYKEV